MSAPITDRDLNALSASALARGDRFTVALVARARREETPEHAAVLADAGWETANWRACLAEADELCRRSGQ